jgi:hypothetical protein
MSGMEMSDQPTDALNLAMLIGRLDGRMGELVHSVNNTSGKIDGLHKEFGALGREVGALTALARDVSENKASIAAIQAEIATIKERQTRQDTAGNVLWELLKSPVVVYIVMFAGFVFYLMKYGVK